MTVSFSLKHVAKAGDGGHTLLGTLVTLLLAEKIDWDLTAVFALVAPTSRRVAAAGSAITCCAGGAARLRAMIREAPTSKAACKPKPGGRDAPAARKTERQRLLGLLHHVGSDALPIDGVLPRRQPPAC